MKTLSDRVNELIYEEKKKLSDEKFFKSGPFEEMVIRKLKNVITGCCDYMQEQGFAIDRMRERRIKEELGLDIVFEPGNELTAYATMMRGRMFIKMNPGNEIIQRIATREERYIAALGLGYHELGHVLYSNFPSMKKWSEGFQKGKWTPKVPDGINTPEGQEIQMLFDAPEQEYRDVLVKIAHNLQNAIEDGYIEWEMGNAYPGTCRMALSTLNVSLIEMQDSLADSMNNAENVDALFKMGVIFGQILRYAKFAEMDFGQDADRDYPEMIEVLEDCMDDLDKARVARKPEDRYAYTNEVMIKIWPFIRDAIEDLKQQYEEQKAAQNSQQAFGNSGKQHGLTGSGAGSQSGSGASSADKAKAVADAIAKAIDKATEGAAVKIGEANANQGAPVVNHTDKAQSGNGSTNSPANKGDECSGAGLGGADVAAAKRDVISIEDSAAEAEAKKQAEMERTAEMNKDAKSIASGINVVRAPNVSEENIRAYQRVAPKLEAIADDMCRSIRDILRDRKEGGRRRNLYTGRRFEVSHWCQNDDFKDFSKVKWPTECPTLGFGVLIDESGSTSGALIDAAMRTALVLELFASKSRGLDIKHIINGYTGGWSNCTITSYSEAEKISEQDDLYRITGMNANGGTPTCTALKYMHKQVKKLNCDISILFVITDGQSGDNVKTATGTWLRDIVHECEHDSIMVIPVGIGAVKDTIRREFDDKNFVDITDLSLMPQKLADIIKKNLPY